MKVVIFCGGLGVRMGEETQRIPKPMIRIGNRPILWHIMKYYASFGHTDFVLCLGYKGEVIKEYFLDYNEALFNDFVLDERRHATSSSSSRDVSRLAYHVRRHRRCTRRSASGSRRSSRTSRRRVRSSRRTATG